MSRRTPTLSLIAVALVALVALAAWGFWRSQFPDRDKNPLVVRAPSVPGGAGADTGIGSDPGAESGTQARATYDLGVLDNDLETGTPAAEGTGTPAGAGDGTTVTATSSLEPTASPTPRPRRWRVWGAQFPLDWVSELRKDDVAIELPRAGDAGLTSVRTNVEWRDIEPENTDPAVFNWRATDQRLLDFASAGNDVVLTIVAYPSWATVYQCGYAFQPGMEGEWRQFVRALAEHYRARRFGVVAYEIGNEVDGKSSVVDVDHDRPAGWAPGEPTVPLGGCWGDRPTEYLAFLRIAYEEIKAVDPRALVTLGGLAFTDVQGRFHRDFLDRLLDVGGGAYLDFVGYHWFPDLRLAFPEEPTGPEKYERIREALTRHGLDLPIWLTETLRLTAEGDMGSEAVQVEFLTKELIELLATTDLERVYWYGWTDYANQAAGYRQRGLVRADHEPKPALKVLPYVVRYTDGRPEDASTGEVVAYRFRPLDVDGSYVIAWSRDGSDVPLDLPAEGADEATVTTFPVPELTAGPCCSSENVAARDGRFTFTVGADSRFIALPAP